MGFKSKRKWTSGGSKGPKPFDYKAYQRKQKALEAIKPEQLVKKAKPLEEKTYVSKRLFSEMPIRAEVLANIAKKGYQRPTEIQDRSVELIQSGKNLLGIAKTGTGKTGAFLIPTLHRFLEQREEERRVLIMVPTRELALQVEGEFLWMAEGLGLKSICFIGGTSIQKDLKRAKEERAFVVGTPGRLLDLYGRRVLNLDDFKVLVLDEFDRMLDMGFAEDVQKITGKMRNRDQTLLFSATLDKTQRQIIDRLIPNREEVRVSTGGATADHIEQDIIRMEKGQNKFEILVQMLAEEEFQKVLLFCETKREVVGLTKRLKDCKIKADDIHGDKSQAQRLRALDKFKAGKVQVLVATDVAARGLDVSDVTHVINYQMPQSYDSYIHRIGRTGRAGKQGKAFTFVDWNLLGK